MKRYYGRGNLHFITFSCYHRPCWERRMLEMFSLEALAEIRVRYEFLLSGYVVMPEHVHLLIGESRKGNPSLVLKMLKERVSRDLRDKKDIMATGQTGSLFIRDDEGLPRFWQARFYDFNVYSAKKKKGKLEYMHANPVKRGLVEHPSAWVWSSFSFYSGGGTGLVTIDPV